MVSFREAIEKLQKKAIVVLNTEPSPQLKREIEDLVVIDRGGVSDRRSLVKVLQKSESKGNRMDIAVSSSMLEADRFRKIELGEKESIYNLDPMTFTFINKIASDVAGKGVLFTDASDSDIDKVKRWIDVFNIDLRQVISTAIVDVYLNGTAWIQKALPANPRDVFDFIKSVNPTAGNISQLARRFVVKLVNMPPTTVDFSKDEGKRIKLNEHGEPSGFDVVGRDGGIETVDRDRMMFIRLFKVSGSWYGLTPLDALYKPILIRLNIEDMLGEVAYSTGSPVWIAYIGDPNTGELPTPDEISKVEGALSDPTALTSLILPRTIRIERMRVENTASMVETLQYFLDQQAMAFGVPLAMLSAVVKQGAEGTIRPQNEEYNDLISDFRDMINQQFREQLFTQMRDILGLERIPRMVFIEKGAGIKTAKARRLSVLARGELITPTPVLEKYIREVEGLPVNDPFLDVLIEDAVSKRGGRRQKRKKRQ